VASADVTSGKAPLIVTFNLSASDDPDGTITGYSWEFMDGSFFSAEANPSHTFTSAGTYSVILTVTDNLGMTASDIITITVRKGKRK
jgi:PKD repeat protein